MVTQAKTNISQESSESQSTSLAMQAKMQMLENGRVTVKCPKCQQPPHVDIWGKYQERITIRCACGYIKYMELGL